MGFNYTSLAPRKFEMPDDWRVVSIDDVAVLNELSIQPDYPHKRIEYIDIASVEKGTVKSVQELPLDDAPSRAKRIVQDKDTLLATVRPNLEHYAYIKKAKQNTIASTGFAVVTAKKVNPRFLYYYLTTKPFTAYLTQIADSHTSAYPAFNPDIIETAQLLLPPLPDQRAISAIMGALDDKIELNRRMNQTLEAMAQALFKNWFVDFDPFRDEGMEESKLGPIPRGWRCATASKAVEINPSRKVERGANAIHVDMASLSTVSARVLTVIRRAFTGSGSRFRNGDVLLARITPCLENGKTAIVDFLEEGENGWGSTEFIVLGPKPPLSMSFIYCLARDPDFRAHAIQAMTGTSGRQRVDTGCFNNYWLAIPPQSVAERFNHKVRHWFQRIKANDDESHTLATIRDSLLPKLLSGEIRVKDAEKLVEETV